MQPEKDAARLDASTHALGAGYSTHPPVAIEPVIAQLAALFVGLAILISGSGLLGTLLSVRGDIEGFPTEMIGVVMSAYFVGFIVGAHFGPAVVARGGHIRAFTAMASIVSATALLHAMIPSPWVWLVLRVVTGFCFASLYLIAESWLNERSTTRSRGRVLSVYMIISFGGLLIGQLLLTIDDPRGFVLFGIASVAFSLSIVPIAMTRTVAPAPSTVPRVSLRDLFALSPFGTVGVVTSGLVLGAFWALAPVFARDAGLDRFEVAYFMAATVFGGLLCQWPIGRASDICDRRLVIGVASAVAAISASYIATLPSSRLALVAAALIYGGAVFPLYSLSLAHANDIRGERDVLSLGSGLLFVYGTGAAIGPLIAGMVMGWLGPSGLYGLSAVILAVTAGYGAHRIRRRPGPPPEAKESFVASPRTTPAALDLHPQGKGSGPGDVAGKDALNDDRYDRLN